MDVGAVLIKLKANTQAKVEAWQQEIQQRKAEAIQTLQATLGASDSSAAFGRFGK